MTLIDLLWLLAGLVVVVFVGRFLAHSLKLVLYILLIILAVVFFFDISLSEVLLLLRKIVLLYL
jgi:hypothetical protein